MTPTAGLVLVVGFSVQPLRGGDLVAILTYNDMSLLTDKPEQLVNIYIEDVTAQAVAEAPCLASQDLPAVQEQAARAILRQAVLRWLRAGEGGVTTEQETYGPFSRSTTVDSAMRGEGRLFPSEVLRLQKLCSSLTASTQPRKAFSIMPRLG